VILLEEKNIFFRSLYHDPCRKHYNHMYFFRIKTENLNKLWDLTPQQLLLLINIWIYDKEKNKERLTNKELNTIDFKGIKFNIAKTTSNISSHLKKLEELKLITVNGSHKNREFKYNFGRQCKDFRSIPLVKILHWLESTDSNKGLNTYIYLLFNFYNKFRHQQNNIAYFGVRELNISHSEIGKDLGITAANVKTHCDLIEELGLIDKEKNSGEANTYYVPFYSKGEDTIVAAKTRSEKDIPEKIREKYNIEFKGGE